MIPSPRRFPLLAALFLLALPVHPARGEDSAPTGTPADSATGAAPTTAPKKPAKSKAKKKKSKASPSPTPSPSPGASPGPDASATRPNPAVSGSPTPQTEEEEAPTTVVAPSEDTADSEDSPKTSADANRCTQCEIQAEAHRKLVAEEVDANDNVKKNQELQATLKPDKDRSAWIKVESNLRMWDIKLESLKKNISALETQLKECQSCLNPQGAK